MRQNDDSCDTDGTGTNDKGADVADQKPVFVVKSEHDILTPEQAAAEVGVSIRFIWKSLNSDEPNSLRGRKIGGKRGWVITRRALTEWVESGQEEEESAV